MLLEPETETPSAAEKSAHSSHVWMRVAPADDVISRRWVRLRYSSSYYDDPVRPLIQFTTSDGREFVQTMNGPVLGSGEWIGRVPKGCVKVSVSPRGTPGAFGFQLDSAERFRRHRLMRRGIEFDPFSLLQSVGAKLINATEERWETLKFAASATPFEDYAEWHRSLYREIDLNGLDRPRTDWNSTAMIRLIMPLNEGGAEGLIATLSSLRSQVYRRWSLHALRRAETPPDVLAAYREQMRSDERLREIDDEMPLSALASDLSGHDYVAIIEPGDTLPTHSLAAVAETLAHKPELRVVYGDEDAITAEGRLHSPLFKPDWNSVYFDAWPYFGRLTCVRYGDLAEVGQSSIGGVVRYEHAILKRLVTLATATGIGHVRRILYRRLRAANSFNRAAADAPPTPRRAINASMEVMPEVTIVIPTRDRVELLRQCTDGLRNLTNYPNFNVVVVDNGTVDRDARSLLQELSRLPQFKIIERPGKFNFSSLCNDGAGVTNSPMLVFLNNDIVIFDPGWLSAMVRWAMKPEIGVVGAKLLFPNDTIEHAGVVLGHGGIAGHIYHGWPASELGYLRQLELPREVGAVTGACIAVQRHKFEAVGGFDADNLPVDLNDIDLCLRISSRGWKTVWTPEAVLYHQQSASRGSPLKPFNVYKKERRHFVDKWSHAIRDDPYFHPALSLYSHRPALA